MDGGIDSVGVDLLISVDVFDVLEENRMSFVKDIKNLECVHKNQCYYSSYVHRTYTRR